MSRVLKRRVAKMQGASSEHIEGTERKEREVSRYHELCTLQKVRNERAKKRSIR